MSASAGPPADDADARRERLRRLLRERAGSPPPGFAEPAADGDVSRFADFSSLEGLSAHASRLAMLAAAGFDDPFHVEADGVAGAKLAVAGRSLVNFSSYNYLGLNGDPRVSAAARAAIDRHGTSVSASRVLSGERPPHAALEQALARFLGAEAAVAMVSGYLTSVTLIGHLLGPRDLVVHDELVHNSATVGAALSGARRLTFPHNDWQALDRLLAERRARHERVLV